MEISFSHKTVNAYREISCPVKRIQETLESVVPDTNDDIGRIAASRTSVLLKSKDVSNQEIHVSGEVQTTLLYITENEAKVSFVQLRKEFEMVFEADSVENENLTQVRLSIGNVETHVTNPRKVAVTVELLGTATCYQGGDMPVETLVPEDARRLLHCKTEQGETSRIHAVCEKTFAWNEQYRFPDGKPEPSQLVFQDTAFQVEEIQQVGNRAVVKGTVSIEVCYLSPEVNYPLRTVFRSPFSQIVDTGAEENAGSTAFVELTGAYYDLVDTISGEKALDVELHAVLQMQSRSRQGVRYIADAYSNCFPCVCSKQNGKLVRISETDAVRIGGDGDLEIAEDCEDVVCVLPTLLPYEQRNDSLKASLGLDVIYRNRSGSLAAVKRQMDFPDPMLETGCRVCSAQIETVNLRPEGSALHCKAELVLMCQRTYTDEVTDVSSVVLDEDKACSQADYPSITIVHKNAGDLWELAKRYHSSVEEIEALQETLGEETAGFLLIPRES